MYSNFALSEPTKFKIIAGADPDEEKRKYFSNQFNLENTNLFTSWEQLFDKGKIADIAIITLPDTLHFDPAMAAMKLGYHVLLEKPMATTKEECEILSKTSEEHKRILQICHVLRYTNFYSKINESLKSGLIGDVVNINMMENVSYYHYAHSFIRGNWHNRDKSSPMILAKCSHDLDAMYWFANSKPKLISSFGGLDHFTIDQDNIPERCTDGCPIENSCLYYAPRIYEEILPLLHITAKSGKTTDKVVAKLTMKYPNLKKITPFSKINNYSGWPVSVITAEKSIEAKRSALENGPYGRCVYKVEDHDVVDHQVVSVLFENNITATLTMHGHSSEEGRFIRIEGTKGTIVGEFLTSHQSLEHIDSLTNAKSILYRSAQIDGHGGGDEVLIENFVDLVESTKRNENVQGFTDSSVSLISHLMAFAADKARIDKTVIEFENF
ncbi:MAG: Gfo/Idh/MocA family oxidoreductase [Candidatus Heimdallarchaeota archaeon]|nr:Gfo/Idh/MocA family oxidoreductase [Candidatus Heimdallarchaeota archaeon]